MDMVITDKTGKEEHDPIVEKKEEIVKPLEEQPQPKPTTNLSMDEQLIRKALEYFAECLHDCTEAVLAHTDPTSEQSDKFANHLARMKTLRNALMEE